ncbi:MAG TPA: AraC family transcriptional regulator [Candidatus Gemmiger faecigallinarum]|nr:AraC family transcriptional regulator [Candidatus Gemmiger faecigallinarum]
MGLSEKLSLLQEFLQCGSSVSLWHYDADGNLVDSNYPQQTLLSTAFTAFGCRDRMLSHAASHDNPILLGDALGLVWGAAFEKQDGKLQNIYVLGPTFFADVSLAQVEEGLKRYHDAEASIAWKIHLLDNVPTIPVCNFILFSHYLLMLHFCLTTEKLDVSALNVTSLTVMPDGEAPSLKRDRHKIYSAEQAMLQMVRNGDLNYKESLSGAMNLSIGPNLAAHTPLSGAKTSDIIFCTLVCRAAIEGGLSPEEAYSLNDSYLQLIENACTWDELVSLPLTMYNDFIHRVHRCRENPKVSAPIQKCIDYIELHLDRRILASELAALIGYSEYYVTRKFKEETGYFINDYIKFAKVERAKILLANAERDIADVAEMLGFGSQSYFGQIFKEVTGSTPAVYRATLFGKHRDKKA